MSLSSSLAPRRAWVLILATSLITAGAFAQSKPTAAPVEHPGCFLLMELKTGKVTRIHPEQCSKRLAPASTFKVPHALIALETGVLSGPEEVRPWDGTKHFREMWNQDQTLDTAMRHSALWFFQGTAKQIGRERMEDWLKRLRYGNTSASGDITRFWIDGTLRITRTRPVEGVLRDLVELSGMGHPWTHVHASRQVAVGPHRRAVRAQRADAEAVRPAARAAAEYRAVVDLPA